MDQDFEYCLTMSTAEIPAHLLNTYSLLNFTTMAWIFSEQFSVADYIFCTAGWFALGFCVLLVGMHLIYYKFKYVYRRIP